MMAGTYYVKDVVVMKKKMPMKMEMSKKDMMMDRMGMGEMPKEGMEYKGKKSKKKGKR